MPAAPSGFTRVNTRCKAGKNPLTVRPMLDHSNLDRPLREQLLLVASAFCEARGYTSLKRVSTLVFNDGKALDRIASGRDLVTGSFEKAMVWFSTHWPEDAAWPSGVARPVACVAQPKPTEEAAA